MGIDRSNVRFVIHAGMPKSIENYQQEAGRAGRDRLAAECILFHSAQDAMTWRSMYKEATGEFERSAIAKIEEMSRFCRTLTCRHRFLVQYFGQAFPEAPCGACDVCLAEHASLPDATTVARKILSGVARVQERYGARHVAEVLKGAKSQKLLQAGHDRLSTYGLLAEHQLNDILDWIDQLIGHGHLVRAGDYPVLQLTPSGRTVMRGELDVVLTVPKAASAPRANRRTFEGAELSAGEEALFQHLRAWRRELAQERGVPPYLILGDVSLRELALTRPATVEALRGVRGIGEVKARDLGDRLLSALQAGAAEQGLALGAAPEAPSRTTPARPNATRETAFAAFAEGRSIAEVAAATGRSPGTIEGYLLDFIGHTGRTDPAPWLDADRYRAILETAESLQAERLKPIFEALHGEVPYGNIRLAMALRANQAKESVLDPLAPPR